jgi:hypothetical protein
LNRRSLIFSDFFQSFSEDKLEAEVMENIDAGVYTEEAQVREVLDDFVRSYWVDSYALVRDIRSFEVQVKADKFQDRIESFDDEFASEGINEDGSHIAWLEVDLTCSDSEITAAFSGWLKRTRDKAKNKIPNTKRRKYKLKQFSSATLRKWHDAKVLAYLDLVAWNSLKCNKVTSKTLGSILFPNPKDPRDSTTLINDTVKPLAYELISKNILDRITKVLSDENRQKIARKTS